MRGTFLAGIFLEPRPGFEWVTVTKLTQNAWRHIFVTRCHIPDSMWCCQVSKRFFLTFPWDCHIFWNWHNLTISSLCHIRKNFAVDFCIFTSARCRVWVGCNRGSHGASGGCGGVRWGDWIAVWYFWCASQGWGNIHTTTHCSTLQHTATHCNTRCSVQCKYGFLPFLL